MMQQHQRTPQPAYPAAHLAVLTHVPPFGEQTLNIERRAVPFGNLADKRRTISRRVGR